MKSILFNINIKLQGWSCEVADYSGPFLMRLERRVWTLPMASVTLSIPQQQINRNFKANVCWGCMY